MRMRSLSVFAATTSVLFLIAGSAWASPPYGVSVGGDSSPGSHSFSGAAGYVGWAIQDATTVYFGCSSLQLAGTVTTGPSGINPYFDFTSWSFIGCITPSGNQSLTQTYTASLSGTTPATLPLVDDIAGFISNIDFHVAWQPIASLCNYEIVGGFATDFDEPTQTLNFDETGFTYDLTLANVNGCGGQLHDGDPVDMAFSFSPTVAGGGDINLFG